MKKLKEALTKYTAMFGRFLQNWSEAWAFIPVVLIIIFWDPLIHQVDPTAGGFDIGYLAKFMLALVFMLAVHGCTWIGIKFNYPTLFKYSDNGFSDDWKQLSSWQKIRIYFFVPAFLLLLFVALIIAL